MDVPKPTDAAQRARAIANFNRTGAIEPERFTIACTVDDGNVSLRFKGHVRMVHAHGLMNAFTSVLDTVPAPAPRVTVDLTACTGLDSSTGGLLILMGKELHQRGTRMVLRRPSERIQRILAALGVGQLTSIEVDP